MPDQYNIFDEKLINIRKNRVKNNFTSFLHEFAINDLNDRLLEIGNNFTDNLLVGHFAEYWINKVNLNKIKNITDEEFLKIPPKSQDLIISALHLHSNNDPISKMVQMRHGLKKNGIFVGYAFGEKSLYELRKSFEYAEIKNFGGVSPRVHPMIDTPTFGSLLRRSGFNFCVSDKLHFEIKYSNPLNLIIDLKGMGETNCLLVRSKRILNKKFLKDVIKFYKTNFLTKTEDGEYLATFDIICLTGWNSKPESLIPKV